MSEMMFPVETLYGTEFFSTPLPNRWNDMYIADVFRIMAAHDGTLITVDQGTERDTYQLNAGQFKELEIEWEDAHFTSNKPISVTQYALSWVPMGIGDPFQMQLIPSEAYTNAYRFYTPAGFLEDYVIITAPNSTVSSVTLNGLQVNGFHALPGGTHQYAVVEVLAGQNVVTADQPIAVYGVGFEESISYGYPAGF